MPKLVGTKKDNVATSHGYLKTGFHSMDCAFNPHGEELGIPYGTLWEIYGASHTAKSTTSYSLASMLAAHLKTGWVICDVEDAFTPEYVLDIGTNMGMDEDTVIAIAEGQFHEDRLQDIYDKMMGDSQDIGIGILDSLGMVASRAELEGNLSEANMGKRAFLLNQWVRKFFYYKSNEMIPSYSTIFAINHQLASLGGYGMNRPGGSGKDYGAGVRVHLKREKEFDDGSYLIKATIKKLRWMGGGMGNEYRYVSKVGYGMHKGLSAIIDAKNLGLLTIGRGIVKIGDESLGRFSGFLKDYKNEEKFQPIYELFDLLREKE